MNKEELRECQKHGTTMFGNYDGKWQCKACQVEATQKRRDKIKQMAIYYKGNKCSLCGYDKCIDALDFHHLNPEEKEFGIAEKGYTKSWETIKQELDKCILVCSNCHRELHSSPAKNIFSILEIEESINNYKVNKQYLCIDCGKEIDHKAIRCTDCNYKYSRKVERPSKEELLQLIIRSSFAELGRKFGVADNTIKSWCKSYNLPSTKKELKELYKEEIS